MPHGTGAATTSRVATLPLSLSAVDASSRRPPYLTGVSPHRTSQPSTAAASILRRLVIRWQSHSKNATLDMARAVSRRECLPRVKGGRATQCMDGPVFRHDSGLEKLKALSYLEKRSVGKTGFPSCFLTGRNIESRSTYGVRKQPIDPAVRNVLQRHRSSPFLSCQLSVPA